jgi:hypothetical protein
MRLAARMRKLVYPVILVLLPLVFAVGPAGQAFGEAPVAKYIGADAYTSPGWTLADTPGQEYYLGSLQSQKLFYSDEALPSNDAATTSNNAPGCGARNGDTTYVYPATMLCIITWNTATKNDGSDLHAFLESTLNDQHQIIMSFCNEPEIRSGGCTCVPVPSELLSCTAQTFISQFEVEANYITKFEQDNHASNVKVAEISWPNYYTSGDCSSYIVPAQYVSYYLADVYEPDLTTAQNLSHNSGWNHWVTCTDNNSGVARGISEYGIDCPSEQASQMVVASTFQADDAYLKANFPGLEVWSLWDSGTCAINSTDERAAVATWQNIEAGN